jgi:uncharacterized membrane protein HdeD (DUF308 family)
MSPLLVASCYGSAIVLALLALWYFDVKHWWWHVLSVVLALAIGLTRLPEPFQQPFATLLVGWLFLFFFVWGVAAPIVAALQHPPRIRLRHR